MQTAEAPQAPKPSVLMKALKNESGLDEKTGHLFLPQGEQTPNWFLSWDSGDRGNLDLQLYSEMWAQLSEGRFHASFFCVTYLLLSMEEMF